MDEETPLREQCRNLRLDTGYSMEDLAALCRISAGTISNFESGKSSPMVDTLVAYLRPLGYELVIKRKAMRPVRRLRHVIQYMDACICPACNRPFSGTEPCNYCCHCGQEIDWSEIIKKE